MKEYQFEYGPCLLLPDNHCVFCEHCTDIFWDYTNGPYMVGCKLHRTIQAIYDNCIDFTEVIKNE